LIAFSLKRSNIIVIEDDAERAEVNTGAPTVTLPAMELPRKPELDDETLQLEAVPKAAPEGIMDAVRVDTWDELRRGTALEKVLATRARMAMAATAAAATAPVGDPA